MLGRSVIEKLGSRQRVRGPDERTGRPAGATVRSSAVGEADRNRWLVTVVAVAVASGLVLRFLPLSPMWLDEAISASLAEEARRGWTPLVDALRYDGHPPLYYVLLAVWTSLVGEGDAAVRAFSGALGVMSVSYTHLTLPTICSV